MALVSTDPEDSGSTDGGPREEQTGPADQITEKKGTKVANFGDEKKIQRRQAKTWRKYERELRCILKAKRRLVIALDKDENDMGFHFSGECDPDNLDTKFLISKFSYYCKQNRIVLITDN